MNDERLQVRGEPTQYAAADAALRAGVQAMQERRERELAQQPKLPEACAKVLRSLRNHWDGLTLFVEDPDLPMGGARRCSACSTRSNGGRSTRARG